MMASRQSLEDLLCDVKVGPASDQRSDSTQEIKIEIKILSPPRLPQKIEMLNTLSQKVAFTCVGSRLA